MPDPITLGSPRRSALISALVHAVVILLILAVTTSKHSPIAQFIPVREALVYPLQTPRSHIGGGGGGQHSPLPVPKGQPPKTSPRPFTMPVMQVRETPPALEMPPEIQSWSTSTLPAVDLAHIGNPNGQVGPMSGGPGKCCGLGDSEGTGMGSKGGPGEGDDPGGPGITALRGKNATKPVLLSQKEPEYSDEARKVKLQGTVVLSIVVTAAGQVASIRVVRGLGLDEKAADAVRQWRFRAATVDGKPVAAGALVEVNFRLL